MDFIFLEWLNEFWLNNETFIIVTFIFMGLDILSGVLKALFLGCFSTSVMRTGFGHKFGIILALCAIAIIQVALFDPHFTLDFDFPLFDVCCGLVIFMELCSILENACAMNPQLEAIFSKFLSKKNDDDAVNVDAQFGDEKNDWVTAEFADVVKGDSNLLE